MNTLPFDYQRCLPIQLSDMCQNCKRWFNHPEQKNKPYGQCCVTAKGYGDQVCDHIPISTQEQK
ncbi:hypothetical protein UFOVP393_74 [uncultured Caudovirales phage]|uniref:Uncharacterized protein n=1 Tax=uncultured Caudovirales phage TaxID=2100421 RepID=A0A6J7X7J1_9CAUD|nr:hypothetical protein UFOVP393_74 [uncultured Caudovirales phage]